MNLMHITTSCTQVLIIYINIEDIYISANHVQDFWSHVHNNL